MSPDRLVGIGLGVPGFVERDSGVWLGFPRVPQIRDLPLRPLLSQRYAAPVHMQNEINVWALAELARLQGEAPGDMLMITCAEGLKASVVVDGRILHGDYGNFGSIGHFIVEDGGRPLLLRRPGLSGELRLRPRHSPAASAPCPAATRPSPTWTTPSFPAGSSPWPPRAIRSAGRSSRRPCR